VKEEEYELTRYFVTERNQRRDRERRGENGTEKKVPSGVIRYIIHEKG
jgi:hypothetical protein